MFPARSNASNRGEFARSIGATSGVVYGFVSGACHAPLCVMRPTDDWASAAGGAVMNAAKRIAMLGWMVLMDVKCLILVLNASVRNTSVLNNGNCLS